MNCDSSLSALAAKRAIKMDASAFEYATFDDWTGNRRFPGLLNEAKYDQPATGPSVRHPSNGKPRNGAGKRSLRRRKSGVIRAGRLSSESRIPGTTPNVVKITIADRRKLPIVSSAYNSRAALAAGEASKYNSGAALAAR
jgi:hypothetical protein